MPLNSLFGTNFSGPLVQYDENGELINQNGSGTSSTDISAIYVDPSATPADGDIPEWTTNKKLKVSGLRNISSVPTFKGSYDASGNNPDIKNSFKVTGEFYVVSNQGVLVDDVNGQVDELGQVKKRNYLVGDYLIYNGTKWDHIYGSSAIDDLNENIAPRIRYQYTDSNTDPVKTIFQSDITPDANTRNVLGFKTISGNNIIGTIKVSAPVVATPVVETTTIKNQGETPVPAISIGSGTDAVISFTGSSYADQNANRIPIVGATGVISKSNATCSSSGIINCTAIDAKELKTTANANLEINGKGGAGITIDKGTTSDICFTGDRYAASGQNSKEGQILKIGDSKGLVMTSNVTIDTTSNIIGANNVKFTGDLIKTEANGSNGRVYLKGITTIDDINTGQPGVQFTGSLYQGKDGQSLTLDDSGNIVPRSITTGDISSYQVYDVSFQQKGLTNTVQVYASKTDYKTTLIIPQMGLDTSDGTSAIYSVLLENTALQPVSSSFGINFPVIIDTKTQGFCQFQQDPQNQSKWFLQVIPFGETWNSDASVVQSFTITYRSNTTALSGTWTTSPTYPDTASIYTWIVPVESLVTPQLTSATSGEPEFTITDSGALVPSWQLFDKGDAIYVSSSGTFSGGVPTTLHNFLGTLGPWFKISLNAVKKFNSYAIINANDISAYPYDWDLYGSNVDSTNIADWTVIDSRTNQSSTPSTSTTNVRRLYNTSTTREFQYIVFHCKRLGGSFNELYMKEFEIGMNLS